MIRSNVPLPFLFRLRLRAGFVAGRAGACQRRLWETAATALTQPPVAASHPDDSPAAWQEFVASYEQLTDVLCDAARCGVTPERELHYASVRRWFNRRYECVAHRVRPRLQGADAGIRTDAGRRALDSLEKILVHASLRELLANDRGDLIPRVAGISQAIYDAPDA